MKYGGWYQVAFAHQLKSDLSSLELGDRRLLVVRTGDDYEIFEAACPHRGMDLGFGKMVGDRVVQCPYHGHRISLGGEGGGPFCVRQYRSLLFQGLILALVGDFDEGPLPATLAGIGRTHKIFHGFETAIRAPLDVVMDNTFDWAHFTNVHHLLGMKHSETIVEDGVLSATSMLKLRASIWQAAPGGA
ncbi:MAG TPA: Rieske 2Fe-2S domain-containing protein, partial [Candidatus Binatus sp.]|nr:Rieske 2Fe-2S domain-containing protein [Candidatus Binatus sp.]